MVLCSLLRLREEEMSCILSLRGTDNKKPPPVGGQTNTHIPYCLRPCVPKHNEMTLCLIPATRGSVQVHPSQRRENRQSVILSAESAFRTTAMWHLRFCIQ
jgi:hypothetical protein